MSVFKSEYTHNADNEEYSAPLLENGSRDTDSNISNTLSINSNNVINAELAVAYTGVLVTASEYSMQSESTIDIVNDDKRDKGVGRRITLCLTDNKWYNPRAKMVNLAESNPEVVEVQLSNRLRYYGLLLNILVVVALAIRVVSLGTIVKHIQTQAGSLVPTGPYRLLDAQYGSNFFDNYDFFAGHDSGGSAGFNVYVSKEDALSLQIAGVKEENGEEFVYMSSSPTKDGPRSSVRLEGKQRFDRGLFVLDVIHMPNGPGVWPAFWLTDVAAWPKNGEVDILEGWSFFFVMMSSFLYSSSYHSTFCLLTPFVKV